jgi:GcrA cell cycle regulator
MSWTDERIATLTKMWEGGATASQIADELGGVSRNAVIGKAHRLGLKSRPSPVKANEAKAAPKKDAATAAKPAAAPKPKPKPATATPTANPQADARPEPRAQAPRAEADAPARPAANANSQPLPGKSENIRVHSVGPGGFVRQGPGEQQAPIPPAPPRRRVPAKPSPEVAGKTSLLDLNDRVCRWPMGHPGEADFHFCGEKVNPGFPYCVEHCGRAYQAQLPRGARRPPPPLPFGGPRVR